MKIVVCTSCNGVGTIKYSPSGDACEIDVSCPRCHGNKDYRVLQFIDQATGMHAEFDLGNIRIGGI